MSPEVAVACKVNSPSPHLVDGVVVAICAFSKETGNNNNSSTRAVMVVIIRCFWVNFFISQFLYFSLSLSCRYIFFISYNAKREVDMHHSLLIKFIIITFLNTVLFAIFSSQSSRSGFLKKSLERTLDLITINEKKGFLGIEKNQ
jgi:hypothetical protein